MQTPVLILTALSILATVSAAFDAASRLRRLRASGRNGTLLFMQRHALRREVMRTVKHALLGYGVAAALLDVPLPYDLIETRTGILAAVALLMGATSLWDRVYACQLELRIRRAEAREGCE